MKTIITIALAWLAVAFLLAWAWHRLRKHGKRIEAEMARLEKEEL